VSLVNTRFFRFNRPVALALAVGGLTLALMVTLGIIVRSQTCTRFQSTTFVPYLQHDSQCTRSSPNAGWLRSSLIEQSSGSFGPSSTVFYHENYTDSWQGWMDAMSAIMANRSSVPKPLLNESLNDTPPSIIRVGDAVSGAAGRAVMDGLEWRAARLARRVRRLGPSARRQPCAMQQRRGPAHTPHRSPLRRTSR
jgi:hypothetical protein